LEKPVQPSHIIFHLKQTGKSVTDLDYFAWEQGPVPRNFFEEINNTPKEDLNAIITINKLGYIDSSWHSFSC